MSFSSLRCAQVLASVDDGASGPSYSVSRLCDELEAKDVAVSLFTVSGWRQTGESATERRNDERRIACARDFARVPGLNRFCISRQLFDALLTRASEIDVFHAHGLWLMPNIYPARAAQRAGRSLVISPRGMLGPAAMQFSRLKKLAFWYLMQRSAVRAAGCLHATSDQEYEEIRAFGLRNPVAVIRNGIDLPEMAADPPSQQPERTVLSLGRIHPKKGLDRLVDAWAEVERRFPDWRLRIVGPDELGYTRKLKSLAAEKQLSRVSFAGPLYGRAKFVALRDADLFVLPTLNENFGLVVAEALAAGTPVVSTKGAPWRELPARGCGWWVDGDSATLATAMAGAMAMPRPVLKEMGSRGRAWMAQDFSWQKVADDMRRVYLWLASQGELPPSVRLT